MIVGHIAPFAPSRCGLYEMARDMIKMNELMGDTVYFIDAGIQGEELKINCSDNRNNFNITTVDNSFIDKCDYLIMHTGIPDSWIVKTQIPLLWVVHGRPLASYLSNNSYELYINVSQWQRTKKLIYFWDEFNPYWENVIEKEKLFCFEKPIIDTDRFNNKCSKHEFKDKGTYNILIADSVREDINLFELMNCVCQVKRQDVKFHFAGIDLPLQDKDRIILNAMEEKKLLGDIIPRCDNIETLYNGSDIVVSPNRIVTRIIAESLSCKTKVIAQRGCKVTPYTCDFAYPKEFVSTLDQCLNSSNDYIDDKMFDSNSYIKQYKEMIKCI
jgi:hypothetical protein